MTNEDNQAQIAHLISTCQARFNEMLDTMNAQFTTFMQNSVAQRPHNSSVNIQGDSHMATDGKGYINWGSDHSILYTHQYVERSQFAAFVSTAMTARFTTTAGRDQIRELLTNLETRSVGPDKRFPANGIYINQNSRLISLYLSRILNACDFGERSMDHAENTTQRKYASIDDAKQSY